MGWIGVDLDGTLAQYDGWKGVEHIGEPVPRMLERVKKWLAEGKEVRILTARVAPNGGPEPLVAFRFILAWLQKHLGQHLRVTHEKDLYMTEFWDDRCVQVIRNTGLRADGKEE